MLKLTDINYSIGSRELLKDVNLIINPGQRSSLLGINGSGKTTLLKIMNGDLESESGEIMKPNHYRIGYLPQELKEAVSGIVIEKVRSGRKDILNIEKELHELRSGLDSGVSSLNTNKLKRLGEMEALYDSLEGYDLERRAKKILFGLGFSHSDLERNISELSGGWQMRVNLASLLISEPDLLLLDEPTNHLDIKAIEWLEKFLRNFRGSVLVVTHDRFFIDRVTESIFELRDSRVNFFPGGYDFYIEKKKADEELALKKMKELLKKKEHLERFINRFRYKATKARQVKSREKEYEKLGEAEFISAPDFLKFQIPVSVSSYLDVISLKDISFKYDRDWVLENIDLEIRKGERIALIGDNGSGKSTLAGILAGNLVPEKGIVKVGEKTETGFYAQHQADVLDGSETVFHSVSSAVPESNRTVIRSVLGLFGFSGDDIEKRIGVLSGGEKSRVSLSRILMAPRNFLIMDEPTNHLDSISRDALESALKSYEGTLLLISHDRYFLDKIVTRVIELKDGKLADYEGNYSYYLSKKEDVEDMDGIQEGLSKSRKDERKLKALSRQSISAERKVLSTRMKKLETEIGSLEKEKSGLELSLSDHSTYENSQRISGLQKRYSEVARELENRYSEWERTGSRIEALLSGIEDR